jgi:hypothetical protein
MTYKGATLTPTNPVDWAADFVNAFRREPTLPEMIGECDRRPAAR